MDIILGLIVLVLVFLLIQLRNRLNFAFMSWLKKYEHPIGSKIMVAFLVGFTVFVLFTDKMPNPGQKIPVIIVSLLLIWANLFLQVGYGKEQKKENQEGEK